MIFTGFEIVAICYLLGSIPFGLIAGRMRGIDIREHGSRNTGATNVVRVLGKKIGIPVFLLDAGKGVAAVLVAQHLARGSGIPGASAEIMGAICCILGHNFPIWLGFKGGKGIATSAGVLIGMLPLAALGSFLMWLAVFYACRYVSIASIAASLTVPLVVMLQLVFMWKQGGWPYFYFALVVGLLAIWRHRANIKRLLNGTEPRFEKKRDETSSG